MAAKQANSTEATTETLLPEIIEEILPRLPVKALVRFKCVSKWWLSLISGANFVQQHLKQGHTTYRLLLSSSHRLQLHSLDYEALINYHDENSAIKDLQVPPQMGSNRPAKILGSCNGLVSLCVGKKILIWNPSTGSHRIIEDTNLIGSYGFGYECFNDDYKLIKVFAEKVSMEVIVQVFSLKTDSWSSIRYESLNLNLVDKVGTFVNGSIFWRVMYGDVKFVASIICFDLRKEKFSHVPLPDCGSAEGWELGVLGGFLSGCYSVYGKDAEVWLKKGTEAEISSWIQMGSIPQPEEPEYIRDNMVPLCVAKNGGAVVMKGGVELYVCNLKQNNYRRIFLYDDQHEFEGSLYAESLVSPNDYGAQQNSHT